MAVRTVAFTSEMGTHWCCLYRVTWDLANKQTLIDDIGPSVTLYSTVNYLSMGLPASGQELRSVIALTINKY